MEPSTAEQWKEKGNAQVAENDFENSITSYTKAIELDPKNHLYYSNRCHSYMQTDNFEKALEDANKCIELKSDWWKGHFRKANALVELKKFDDALNALDDAIKVAPEKEMKGLKARIKKVQQLKEDYIDESIPVGFVECETYEECRDYLIKHPELIKKSVADEMFQKGFFALASHPPEIGTRFIRNSQILSYLLELRKVSHGQQDISLLFARLLDPNNPEYMQNFEKEYRDSVARILKRLKEKEEEKKAKEAAKEAKEKEGNE